MAASNARVIILWSHPRSCSTMFEMAFVQRDEFRVCHEPYGEAYYYGPERMSPRFTAESRPEDFKKYADLTFKKIWAETTAVNAKGKKRTFVKDMAQYIIPPTNAATSTPTLPDFEKDGNPTVIPSDILLHPDIHHAFLIRTPAKAVPSYYRLCGPPKAAITGFDYFDPAEVGLRESKILYDWLVTKGVKPLVIDSSDLLKDPPAVMEYFCNDCKVDFGEHMLEWKGGEAQEQFKKWNGFHDDAEKSNGIAKHAGSDEDRKAAEAKKAKDIADMPDIVHQTIEDTMADYEYLRTKATTGSK